MMMKSLVGNHSQVSLIASHLCSQRSLRSLDPHLLLRNLLSMLVGQLYRQILSSLCLLRIRNIFWVPPPLQITVNFLYSYSKYMVVNTSFFFLRELKINHFGFSKYNVTCYLYLPTRVLLE